MPEEWVKVDIPDGQHLGRAKDDPEALRGHLFNENGDLVGHAKLRRPLPGEPTPDDVVGQYADASHDWEVYYTETPDTSHDWEAYYTETPEERRERLQREHEREEFYRALVETAIKLAILAAPHVQSWWKAKASPALKARLGTIRDRRAAKKADKADKLAARRAAKKAAKKAAETAAAETVALLDPFLDHEEPVGSAKSGSGSEVVLALENARVQMSSEEARQRFAAALIARYFADEQLRLLDGAEIIDPTGQPLTSNAIGSLDIQGALEDLLSNNPEVLMARTSDEARALLADARPRHKRPSLWSRPRSGRGGRPPI
jgi:hypothetical protein